jgi:hypothetical protein
LDNVEEYRQGKDDALDEKNNPLVGYTKWLNYSAVGAFFVGIVATLLFVALNTHQVKIMSTEKKPTTPDEQRGIVPPRLPPRTPTPQPGTQPPPPQPPKK